MKKLLIIAQKVDQDEQVLGFFVEWIREFSKKFEKVTVICLKKGEYSLPENVKVLSLGKEIGVSKLTYLWNFYKYIIGERNNYDIIFVHNNPRYIILGWPVWTILNKKISLWYAHGYVPLMLRIADKLVDVAFVSTKEGYRINSPKLHVVGQGIDVNKFQAQSEKFKIEGEKFKIISVGRISPSKDYGTLIGAIGRLRDPNVSVEVAGEPATNEDARYLEGLKKLVQEKGLGGTVKFVGPIANRNLPAFLQSADLFVNMSHTGSLDKAILEAMACGLPILTCNEALKDVLGSYSDLLMYPKKDSQKLVEKISDIMKMNQEERNKISVDLRNIVISKHNLSGLIKKISDMLQ